MKKLALALSLIVAVFGATYPSSAADDVIRFGVAAEHTRLSPSRMPAAPGKVGKSI
ncbi:hypothetical protein P3C58_21960 [Mesorhizobium sp. XAP10]|uniref:hypothetical protein n=1 Tax=unclassified Mesorhizobium TaxID=325217 RepID=UPI0023DF4B28|nr:MULTISPECIES: hypothetical protein [unclassified Mesorhizobium]MDF3154649.1 hypothetical protein [Mesorhizobium sp. XAP10]MDF3247801.1 hypothetical protein [Mesorhizobium sp. XAP4]